MRVGLPADDHPCPVGRDDLDVCHVDMSVRLYKVVRDRAGEQLGRADGMLLGEDEDGVLDGVGGYDDAVIGFGVAVECSREL